MTKHTLQSLIPAMFVILVIPGCGSEESEQPVLQKVLAEVRELRAELEHIRLTIEGEESDYGEQDQFPKGLSSTRVVAAVAEKANLEKKQVVDVFAALRTLIGQQLNDHGVFTMPGLYKIKVVSKPATKARTGINPFTGEEMKFEAKPARKVIKITPLKRLKDMVQ